VLLCWIFRYLLVIIVVVTVDLFSNDMYFENWMLKIILVSGKCGVLFFLPSKCDEDLEGDRWRIENIRNVYCTCEKSRKFLSFFQRIVVYRDNFYIVVQFNKLTEDSVDTA